MSPFANTFLTYISWIYTSLLSYKQIICMNKIINKKCNAQSFVYIEVCQNTHITLDYTVQRHCLIGEYFNNTE